MTGNRKLLLQLWADLKGYVPNLEATAIGFQKQSIAKLYQFTGFSNVHFTTITVLLNQGPINHPISSSYHLSDRLKVSSMFYHHLIYIAVKIVLKHKSTLFSVLLHCSGCVALGWESSNAVSVSMLSLD